MLQTLIFIGFIWTCFSHEIPTFDLLRLSNGYHGIISENSLTVDVRPAIKAAPDVCSYVISSTRHGSVPFVIQMKNTKTGEAEIVAKNNLNCEKRKSYKFDIKAISCSGIESKNVTVRVKVNDINEYAPIFLETSIVVAVDEGKLYDNIVTLHAEDQDCSPKFGDICRYELLTKGQPFDVDGDGVVKNTQPLDYDKSPNHILTFVAYDCGMKRSQKPVMVTIKVNRNCNLGWKGVPNQVDYLAGSGREELFSSASLEICGIACDVERIETKISLITDHIGKGCDRDTYSVPLQHEICGASESTIELLPAALNDGESTWTSNLRADESHDVIFKFNGDESGVKVADDVLPHNLSNVFTISSWMKHAPSPEKHTKEHLLCAADAHKMNRHHMALFVRNCKLILLLRREYSDVDLNTFQPAEWRWKLPQICDDDWHHYSVQANLPQVKLFVDGNEFHPENNQNSEVIDDWPLHPTRSIDTTLTIGACWQGSEEVMKHGFTGYLAGLSALIGEHESAQVLSCLVRCEEALDAPATEFLQPSMQLLTNNEMTEVVVEGDNVTDIETVVRKVAYLNSRKFPTTGRRPITTTTNVVCGSGKAIKVDSVESFVVVIQPLTLSIAINGTSSFGEEYESFRNGFVIFPDVSIELEKTALEAGAHVPGGQLNECEVLVYPPLNPDHEFLAVPDNLITELGLAATVTKKGATISGPHSTAHYQQILRQLQYTNKKPAYYLNRAFKLTCSELANRFRSNEYIQTVTVIHPQLHLDEINSIDRQQTKLESFEHAQPSPAHLKHEPPHHAKGARVYDKAIPRALQGAVVGGAGNAVTVIMVVCGGFFVFVISLVVVRFRSSKLNNENRQNSDVDGEMIWDDSGLESQPNIIVNPIEMTRMTQKQQLLSHEATASDSEYEDGSNDEVDCSDDDDASKSCIRVVRQKHLDWDDSTLKT